MKENTDKYKSHKIDIITVKSVLYAHCKDRKSKDGLPVWFEDKIKKDRKNREERIIEELRKKETRIQWKKSEELELERMWKEGNSIKDIVCELNKNENSVRTKLRKIKRDRAIGIVQ